MVSGAGLGDRVSFPGTAGMNSSLRLYPTTLISSRAPLDSEPSSMRVDVNVHAGGGPVHATAWIAGAPDDDADNGEWERVDPVGTAAQPYDDHTLWPGTHAWITEQHVGQEGGWQGQSNVNNGKTTVMENKPSLRDGVVRVEPNAEATRSSMS